MAAIDADPKVSLCSREQRLSPVLLITVAATVVSSPVTVASVIRPIIILVTVWIPVIVSVGLVAVVVPSMTPIIPKGVPVAVTATCSKSKREMIGTCQLDDG